MKDRSQRDESYEDRTQGDTQIGDTRVAQDRDDETVTDIATANSARVERGAVEAPRPAARAAAGDEDDAFLPEDRMDGLRSQWDDVQAGFVDDPRAAVQNAHGLVQDLVDELTATFSRERDNLEGQWNSGNVDTEALRVALQRYRAFFNRLLST